MMKIRVEVCIISARGLGRSSSFWKPQWFAVGWIDPNNKYCTKIDASGSANPTWKTKFSALIDDSESDFKDAALHVQVYSREPIFLGEKLQGTAIILLKEFLAKYNSNTTSAGGIRGGGLEEVGSFQLRKNKKKKKNSGKPQGFVDVSIRVSEHRNMDNAYSYSGEEEGFFKLDDGSPSVPATYPPLYAYPTTPHHPPSINHQQQRQSLPRAPTPPPPPPPSHVGYLPTFLPTPHHQFAPPPPSSSSYINLPPISSSAPPHVASPIGSGFGVGVGAGALAAGAVIFGDDFMSGFDFPSALQPQDATLTISTDPLF